MSTVLFVCKANRGRSVMSRALFEQAAAGRHEAISAGSEAEPHGGPHPEVVHAMREIGVDVAGQQPQRLTTELAAQADAVVTMGCGDACPVIPGKKQLRVDWDLPDPRDRPLEEVRATRDDIARRVQVLVAELDGTA
jgi:arsenate reductase (thioredoxin)